jgi:lysophospholipase L1-like esterase
MAGQVRCLSRYRFGSLSLPSSMKTSWLFTRPWRVATAGLVLGATTALQAASPAPAEALAAALPAPYAQWQSSIEAFAAADQARQPQPGGVLFVGSSSIRFWTQLPQDFRQAPVVINRGFGGSTMADCLFFVKKLVVQYQPRQVMVYAGDNDLAQGRTPAQVLESFQGFVRAVRSELPGTRIGYISIKPSPSRATLLPLVRETNALLAEYVRTLPEADYIDIFSPMVDASGAPRPGLFGPDRLHMNEAGYALWRTVIGPFVLPAGLGAPAVQSAAR